MKNVYFVETKRFNTQGKVETRSREYYSSRAKARAALLFARDVFKFDYEMRKDCDCYFPSEEQRAIGYSFIVREIGKAEVF